MIDILYAASIGFLSNRNAGSDKSPILSGKLWQMVFVFLVLLSLDVNNWWIYITAPISVWSWRQIGRGEYRAAIDNIRVNRVQQKWVDPWLEKLIKNSVVYGIIGETMVGTIGGIIMAIGFSNINMIGAGASIGVITYASSKIYPSRYWELAEGLVGALIFATFAGGFNG